MIFRNRLNFFIGSMLINVRGFVVCFVLEHKKRYVSSEGGTENVDIKISHLYVLHLHHHGRSSRRIYTLQGYSTVQYLYSTRMRMRG